jgi:hypothetical protein
VNNKQFCQKPISFLVSRPVEDAVPSLPGANLARLAIYFAVTNNALRGTEFLNAHIRIQTMRTK